MLLLTYTYAAGVVNEFLLLPKWLSRNTADWVATGSRTRVIGGHRIAVFVYTHAISVASAINRTRPPISIISIKVDAITTPHQPTINIIQWGSYEGTCRISIIVAEIKKIIIAYTSISNDG